MSILDIARKIQQRVPVPKVAEPFEAFAIAVDLTPDSAVICIFERMTVVSSELKPQRRFEAPRVVNTSKRVFYVRHLQRLPGAEYPEIIQIVSALLEALPAARMPHALVANVTNVGKPVIVLMAKAGLRPIGVTIADGAAEHRVASNEYRVPEKDLVGTLAVLLQTARFRISADLPEAEALTSELGKLNFGEDDWKESNGLSVAVCLAAWWCERMMPTPKIEFSMAR
jgi:hypothetical protein